MSGKRATQMGALALILWSFSAFFNSVLIRIPIFEILFMALAMGFVVGLGRMIWKQSWSNLKQPSSLYLIGCLGVLGNELLYVTSFKFAPPNHIVLINYLWPIIVVISAGCLSKEKFPLRYLIAALIGFGSMGFLLSGGKSFSVEYWIGYLLVFTAACLWSAYVVLFRLNKQMTSEMLTVYCGVGCLTTWFLHVRFETFYLPTWPEWMALVWLGVIGMGGAFYCWEIGIKKGNIKLLSILSYNNLILSSAILIITGKAIYEHEFALATLGLMMAYGMTQFKAME